MKEHSRTILSVALGAAIGLAGAAIAFRPPERVIAPMPDPKLTPGVTLDVTDEEVCVKGYSKSARHVTQSDKDAVYKSYGIKTHKPGEYEIDHLISLELGGSNDHKNLWPQPYHGAWNAHQKDALENKLHQMVCEGLITLEEAQKEIRENWVEAYEKYISN